MKKLVIVIFGASGDLTKRKLMPALYTLYNGGRLPEGFTILGIGRTEYTDARYQEYIMSELGKFVASKEQVEDVLGQMGLSKTVRGETFTLERFAELSNRLGRVKG